MALNVNFIEIFRGRMPTASTFSAIDLVIPESDKRPESLSVRIRGAGPPTAAT